MSAEVGSNSGFAAERLRSFVERVERIEAEIAALNADKSEIYKEAGGEGFDKKTLRKVVMRRRMDKADVIEGDHLLDLYEAAVNAGAKSNDPLD